MSAGTAEIRELVSAIPGKREEAINWFAKVNNKTICRRAAFAAPF